MTKITNQTGKESFASRWSKRKHRVKLERNSTDPNTPEAIGEPPEVGAPDAKPASTELAKSEQKHAEKLAQLNALKDEDMPDIASLDEDSDFSQFMSTNVSEALRKIALRKLFQGATYNIRDGLDEYDGDYTSFEKLDPSTITSDMKYRQELEAEKLKELQEQERMEQAQAVSSDNTTNQQEPDDSPDETALVEDDNETIRDEASQETDTQAEMEPETGAQQPETAAHTTTEITKENQT